MLGSKRKASNAELAEKKENITHQSGLDSWSCEDKVTLSLAVMMVLVMMMMMVVVMKMITMMMHDGTPAYKGVATRPACLLLTTPS